MELEVSDWRAGHAHLDEPLGYMLRRVRRERGLTLENVALQFCDVSHLAKIERGEQIPTARFIWRLMEQYSALNRPLTVGQRHDIYEAAGRAER